MDFPGPLHPDLDAHFVQLQFHIFQNLDKHIKENAHILKQYIEKGVYFKAEDKLTRVSWWRHLNNEY